MAVDWPLDALKNAFCFYATLCGSMISSLSLNVCLPSFHHSLRVRKSNHFPACCFILKPLPCLWRWPYIFIVARLVVYKSKKRPMCAQINHNFLDRFLGTIRFLRLISHGRKEEDSNDMGRLPKPERRSRHGLAFHHLPMEGPSISLSINGHKL